MSSASPSLLCLCDSITAQTGFARVAQNLIKRWLPSFGRIDIWGIGYNGWPSNLSCQWWPGDKDHMIFPGGGGDWSKPEKLQQLLQVLIDGRYTHLWIMQDPFRFTQPPAPNNFCEMLAKVLGKQKIKFLYYIPIDSPIDPEWLKVISLANVPVAYTEYGRRQVEIAVNAQPRYMVNSVKVLPHGCDTEVYHPLPDRKEVRARLLKGWAGPDDVVFINVNANQRRKAHWNCLELFARLKEQSRHPMKLVMHMAKGDPSEAISLARIAEQLGLKKADWLWTYDQFVSGHALLPESKLNELYNAADYVLTTTLGEGWGFSISESLAAGCMVAAPDHTSVSEIFDMADDCGHDNIVRLPLSSTGVVLCNDLSRVRYPVDIELSAKVVAAYHERRAGLPVTELHKSMKEWLSWDRIAAEWLKLMEVA